MKRFCANVRACEIPVLELEEPGSNARERIVDECRRALDEDGSDTIVLGCAGMADLCDAHRPGARRAGGRRRGRRHAADRIAGQPAPCHQQARRAGAAAAQADDRPARRDFTLPSRKRVLAARRLTRCEAAAARTIAPCPATSHRTRTSSRRSGRRADKSATIESIAQDIATAIVEKRLPPGTWLREEALGRVYAVSRTKIRAALLTLSKDKLIEMIPDKGAFVSKPSVQEAREVFGVRRLLESEVVRLFVGARHAGALPGAGAAHPVRAHHAQRHDDHRHRAREAAGRLPRGAGRNHRQPHADRADPRTGGAQLADRHALPLVERSALLVRRALGLPARLQERQRGSGGDQHDGTPDAHRGQPGSRAPKRPTDSSTWSRRCWPRTQRGARNSCTALTVTAGASSISQCPAGGDDQLRHVAGRVAHHHRLGGAEGLLAADGQDRHRAAWSSPIRRCPRASCRIDVELREGCAHRAGRA